MGIRFVASPILPLLLAQSSAFAIGAHGAGGGGSPRSTNTTDGSGNPLPQVELAQQN